VPGVSLCPGCDVSATTVWRYIREAVDLLAAAPTLEQGDAARGDDQRGPATAVDAASDREDLNDVGHERRLELTPIKDVGSRRDPGAGG
jgi:hypothetical protein